MSQIPCELAFLHGASPQLCTALYGWRAVSELHGHSGAARLSSSFFFSVTPPSALCMQNPRAASSALAIASFFLFCRARKNGCLLHNLQKSHTRQVKELHNQQELHTAESCCALQLAFLRHFQQRPLSFLAAVPGEDLAQACARLPKPLLKEATKLMLLSGRVTGSTVANTLAATAFADARWRLAVLCVNATAVATGHRAGDSCSASCRTPQQ